MSTNVTSEYQIPEASFYVTSLDIAMSGWGMAKGKNNIIIMPCATIEQAQMVKRNAKSRGDQRNIRILNSKPRLNLERNYYSLFAPSCRWYDAIPPWIDD